MLRFLNPSSENGQTYELSWEFLLLTSQTLHWKNNAAMIRKCYLHLVEQRKDRQRLAKFLVRIPLVRLFFHKWHALRFPNHGTWARDIASTLRHTWDKSLSPGRTQLQVSFHMI